jgi:hypothetical protein
MLGTKEKMTPPQKKQQQHDRQRQQRRRPRKHELTNRQHEEECVYATDTDAAYNWWTLWRGREQVSATHYCNCCKTARFWHNKLAVFCRFSKPEFLCTILTTIVEFSAGTPTWETSVL